VASQNIVTVSPFTILVATNEQKPWEFTGIPGKSGQGRMIIKKKWHNLGKSNGDYTIEGAENSDGTLRISIERKSLADLYQTVLSERERFVRELEQLNAMEYAAVIVEAQLNQVMSYMPKYWAENGVSMRDRLAKQRSVLGSIYAWQFRYSTIRWWFTPRRYASVLCYRLLDRFYQEKMV